MSMWVDLLGSQIHYCGREFRTRVIEAGEGTPLILIHGLGGHAEAYSRNLTRLGQHYRALAIDLVWHGFSSKPPFNGDTLPTYARQVIDLLDSLDLESAHVEGTSLGGAVGIWLALHYPTRLKKLILTMPAGIRYVSKSISSPPPHRRPEALRDRAIKIVEEPTRENIRSRLEKFMASPDRVTDELVEIRWKLYADPCVRKSLTRVFENSFGLGTSANFQIPEEDLSKIKNPTLLLWGGRNEGAGPDVGQRIASLIPEGQFVCIEDGAHWVQWEQPELHDRLVISFLKE